MPGQESLFLAGSEECQICTARACLCLPPPPHLPTAPHTSAEKGTEFVFPGEEDGPELAVEPWAEGREGWRGTGQLCPRNHTIYCRGVWGGALRECQSASRKGVSMTPGCLNVFGIEESRPSLPTELCSPVPRRHPCVHTRTHMHVSFRKAVQSSPAWRNAGETEVTEFPSLSCHLLATCGWLLEVAWAGKGSERGSGLLLLAQEQSQQLQSCCEVMPGAAGVFLQAKTDSGRVGWQPQPWRA